MLILTGTSEVVTHPKRETNLLLKFSLHEDRQLQTECLQLPPLSTRRFKHSAFIQRDYLFVVFGYRDEYSYAEGLECLNLNAYLNGDKAAFECI